MIKLNEKFVVDKKGKRIGVQLDVNEYRKLLKALEELESIRAFDAAMLSGEKSTPLEQALDEIERNRP